MIEGEIQVIGEAIMDVALNGREQTRTGNRHPTVAPHGVYPCRAADAGGAQGGPWQDDANSAIKVGQGAQAPPFGRIGASQISNDSWLAIAAMDEQQWRALCGVMEREDLTDDPRFAEPAARYRNQQQLDAIIARWTVEQEKHALQARLQAVGVSAMAALAVDELFEDPHLRSRGLFQFVDHPESQPFPHTRVAFTLSETPAVPVRSGPAFGDANQSVLRDLLALDDAEIARLAETGIIAMRH
jgi:crotonobetainyl-CoA:carnitine CoA-transferase CaiB-like acyl-CoA transferase